CVGAGFIPPGVLAVGRGSRAGRIRPLRMRGNAITSPLCWRRTLRWNFRITGGPAGISTGNKSNQNHRWKRGFSMPRLSPSLLRKILVAAGLCLGVVWAAVGRFCYGGAYHVPALWLLLAAALVLALRAVRRRWLA